MSGSRPDDPNAFDRTEVFRPAGAPAPVTNLPRIPGITLHHEIARGGMGIVYSGRQDFLDRRVAVKLLSMDLVGEKFAQRFQREAKLLAGIKHQNIVACYEAGTTEQGQSYLVMEFVDGPNLKAWIAEQGPLPIAAALRLTKAVAQALGHAHQLGVIHRDVKPENILLETVTSTAIDVAFPFTPKLVDLGLARMTSEGAGLGLTSPGAVMGTPSTMSPEQFDDPDSVDFRTDVYGLGCALYEMLVGAPAFRGNKLTEIVVKKREPVGPDPCAEAPRVPREVGTLVSSMLAANRDHRPSAYKELEERLDALLAALPGEEQRPALRASTPPPASRIATTVPPAPTAGASPPPSSSALPSGPGLLRTAELDFLQAGMARGGTMPAFRDSSSPETPPPSAAPAPARSRRGLVIGAVGVLAFGAAGVWFATRGGAAEGTNGSPDPSPNRPPRIDVIEGPDRIELTEWVTLRARAGDDDGDELSYRWSAVDGDEIGFGDQKGDSTRVRAMDGLPGEAFEVRVAVDDGKGAPTVATKRLVVADTGFAPRRFLAGFESDPRWRFDPPNGPLMWTSILHRDAVSCRAGSALLVASTSMGDETFWQLEGKLESKSDDGERYADTAVRIACDDRAWSLVCTCAGELGERWSIELRAEQRLAGTWEKQLGGAEAQRIEWLQDEDGDVTPYAEFTITRRRGTLVLRWGQGERFATTEVPVPAGTAPELTLWVENGIGRFVDFTLR